MDKRSTKIFLENAPLGWTLIRVPEASFLSKVNLRRPLLDIGCGTGLFAKGLLLDLKQKKFEVGLDLSEKEIKEAKKLNIYRKLVLSDVHSMPFPNSSFATVISNGTLEHVGNLPSAISEISRVLKPGGQLIFTAPSAFFGSYLFFSFIPGYSRLFNNIFGHKNLLNVKAWRKLLEKKGFVMTDYFYYNPRKQVVAHELLTYTGIIDQVSKKLFGTWVFSVKLKNLFSGIDKRILDVLYNESINKKGGGSIFVVAEKK